MNQAVSFGLLGAGGILLTKAITGSSFADVVKGHPGAVPSTGAQLATVAGVGAAAAAAATSAAGAVAAGVSPGATGYVNPFAQATALVPERVDQGQDFSMAPGSPILAPGASKVLGIMSNWYSGQPYVALQLLTGPKAGQNYYVAEQITPAVAAGDTVAAGGVIGHYASSGTGIEIGWAGSNWQQTLAQAQGNTGDASHNNSPAGQAFHQFLTALGVA